MSTPPDLSSLIRPEPDPDAPSSPTGLRLKAWSVLSTLAFFAHLPWTLLRTTIRHKLGRYPKWQRLQVTLRAQVLNLYFWSKISLHLPPPHADEWGVCRPVHAGLARARRGVGVQQVTVEPAPRELVRGIADVEGVQGLPRPGWMLWPEGTGTESGSGTGGAGPEGPAVGYTGGKGLDRAKEGEKVVLYFHSGVYVMGHPLETAFAWNNCKALNVRLFAFNYRKALNDASAHPGPLLDALAAYLYLTSSLHFQPGDVTIMGDSAGGHLALTLTRYLSYLTDLFDLSTGSNLNLSHSVPDLPGALCLASPWGDMTVSSRRPNPAFPSQATNHGQDYVSYLADLSVPASMRHYTPAARRSCWFSPALASADEWAYLARGRVSVYIMYGTRELLADEVKSIGAGMRDAGVDVSVREDVDGMHIGPTIKWPGSDAWQVWSDDIRPIVRGETA